MVTKIKKTDFVEISKIVQLDAQRRITLPNRVVQEGILFRMSYNNNNGQILLEPQVTIPASELWLFNNPDALASVKRGLSDAAQGRVSKVNLDTL